MPWTCRLQSTEMKKTSSTYDYLFTESESANFTIGLTDVSPWTTQPPMVDQGPPCVYYPGTLPLGSTTTLYCDPQASPGRYLFITRTDYLNVTLSFCEVEVYAARKPACAHTSIPAYAHTCMRTCIRRPV